MAEMDTGCRGKGWTGGAFAGLLVAVFLLTISHFSFMSALFLGVITFGLFGSFLVWAFCDGHDDLAPMSAAMPPAAPVATRLPQAEPVRPVPASAPPHAPPPAAAVKPMAEPAKPQTDKAPVTPAKPVETPAPKALETAAKDASAVKPATAKVKVPVKAAAAKPAKKRAPSETVESGKKPRALKAPRKGVADDLKVIEGIGPVLERLCNELGIYHFDQIAKWGAAEVEWMDGNLKGFRGRVTRDKWVAQAKLIGEEGINAFLIRAKTNDY
ncbi:endonuclease [Phaeovulum sp.]|uniref:endonuclease n=1 Tax=Phaeovulum sp. TaxID=2934796 RepID=UPI0039E226AB